MNKVKAIQNTTMYNLLQDLRHIVVIQISQNENNEHLRSALRFDIETAKKEEIEEMLDDIERKAQQQEQKYKQQEIRRVCFVDYGALADADPKLDKYVSFFQQNKSYSQYKLYCLKEGLTSFKQKYPFLVLNNEDFANIDQKKTEIPVDNRDILNLKEKKVLYSYSQFPFEIVDDLLYLGNVYHSNSQMYLQDLKIKTMIDFTTYSEEAAKQIPAFKQEQYDYKNIPLDTKTAVDLDFDEINRFIDTQLAENKGRVLLYCKDGQQLSPGFAISYLMYKKNMNLQLASMKVFAMMGKVEIAKWIYTQLMIYKPKN